MCNSFSRFSDERLRVVYIKSFCLRLTSVKQEKSLLFTGLRGSPPLRHKRRRRVSKAAAN
jgi:hypothetical protein